MKKNGAIVILVATMFFFLAGRVEAYSIEGSSSITGSSDTTTYNLATPFENFFQSLSQGVTSITGGSNINLNPVQEPVGQDVTVEVHGWLNQFDAWLYGFTGFHILAFLTSILSIFSTILGWIKSGVDWLLNFL